MNEDKGRKRQDRKKEMKERMGMEKKGRKKERRDGWMEERRKG